MPQLPPAAGWGPLLAVAGAVAFSGKAIIVKLGLREGADPLSLMVLRMLVALPFFLVMAAWAGRGRAPLPGRDRLAMLGLGFCGYYLASLLDFFGLQHVSAALERLILYLSPAVVLLLSWLWLGQRTTLRQWAAIALAYAGLLLAFGHEWRIQGPTVLLGAALVAGSTLSYAVYLVASGQLVRRIGTLRLTGWASSAACGLTLAHHGLLHRGEALAQLAALPPAVWWLSLLNGTLCTVLPVWLVMAAIERLGSARTAQWGMVGPVSTIALGTWLLGEPFTGWMAAGSLLVLAGVALLARAR